MSLYGSQLPLAFGQTEGFSLEQFLPGKNIEVVEKLDDLATDVRAEILYIWGAKGSGKSHLLQALCKAVSETDQQSVFLPLSQHKKFTPQILEGLEELPVICLDDVDQIAGDEAWERAVFNLFNQVKEANHVLCMSAGSAPQLIDYQLADLDSRMNWGLIYQLQDLDDTEKLQVLQQRAEKKGFDLSDEIGEYLIKRLPRDMHALCNFLDQLDIASLAAKRKLTIPFVRELLEHNL